MTSTNLSQSDGNRPLRHALAFILLTVFVNMVGLGLVIPVIPDLVMAVSGVGLSDAAVVAGYLLFVYAGAQFLFAPLMGNLSDRFGRRPILLLSMAGLAVDYAVMALAPTLTILLVGRVFAGLLGATLPAANAAIADLSEGQTRSRNFGLVGAAGAAGLVMGPALGGLLGEIDIRLPFWAAFAVCLLALIYGSFCLPETLGRAHVRAFDWRRANPVAGLFRVARSRTALTALGALFLFQLAAQCMPATWPFFSIERFGWSQGQIGRSIVVYALALVVVQGVLTGPVTKRIGAGRAGLFSLAIMGLAFGGLAFLADAQTVYGWLVFGALHGFAFPAMQSIMTRQLGERVQGELQGAIASTLSLTAILGPLMMTQTYAHFSDETGLYLPGAAFVLGAGLVLCSMGLLTAAMVCERIRPSSGRAALPVAAE